MKAYQFCNFLAAQRNGIVSFMYDVLSTRTMQFFTRVLVLTSSLLEALYTTSMILVLRVQSVS